MTKKNDERGTSEENFDVRFVADVHLIQVLGEQLIGSEKVGILELIKNAYDASATRCDVWIEKVPGLPDAELSDPAIADLPGPVITIIDNGTGMNKPTIEDGWLRPASPLKTSVKERLKRERQQADLRGSRDEYERLVAMLKKERGGRLPLGEKGVGRFATHRLGQNLRMQTKVSDEPFEWFLEIDWNRFGTSNQRPSNLDEISLTLVRREPRRDYGPSQSGTLLRIYGGRQGFAWTEEKLKDIGHAVAMLQSSLKAHRPKAFDVAFHCPQLSDQVFEPLTDTVPAPFVCTALVDRDGKADIEIRFIPPSSLSKPMAAETWTEPEVDLRKPPEDQTKFWDSDDDASRFRRPDCGPFTVDIKLWLRQREWVEAPDFREFTKFLDKFGGIGIFRDGFSILPAQVASKDDWLGLSTRHIKKGTRISYYEMWGEVDLLQEQTLELVDRTSREGMIETRAFGDLSRLVLEIVEALEYKVKETRDRYNKLMQGERLPRLQLNSRLSAAHKILDKVAAEYRFETDGWKLRDIVGDSEEPGKVVAEMGAALGEARHEIRALDDQNEALLEPVGYGIAIAVAVHEIEKITSNLFFGLERLTKQIGPRDSDLHEQSRRLALTAQSLLNELKRIAPLRVTRLEPRGEFQVRDSVLAAMGAFQLSWQDLKIAFTASGREDDFTVDGSFGMCSQVFANLFDNATYWLRIAQPGGRRIRVEIEPSERKIVVADSGPGIDEKMRPHLFEPYYSLKSPPSGLGLYICNYYMRQMKGTVREAFDAERIPGFPGAHFVLLFPKEKVTRG